MSGMGNGVASAWRPDGEVRYRYDRHQRLIGIMPATCKRGLHNLFRNGCTPRERTDSRTQVRLLVIHCEQCTGPDHSWTLVLTNSRQPDSAEYDDEPYRDIDPHFVERPVDMQ